MEPGEPEGKQRYGGGYTVRHHGLSERVEAWQMEHSRLIRNDLEQRSRYLDVVAKSLVRALDSPPAP